MADRELLERIAVDPAAVVGKPVVRGTRLTVKCLLNLLAHGETLLEIVEEYEGLSHDDVRACVLFAVKSMKAVCFIPPEETR